MAHCIEINRLENEATHRRSAVADLFNKEKDPSADQAQEVYEFFENTIDSCEDVADVLQNVVVKNSKYVHVHARRPDHRIALVFDYINGFHDAANSIATIVATRVLTPFQAVLWRRFQFRRGLRFRHGVAKTVGQDSWT